MAETKAGNCIKYEFGEWSDHTTEWTSDVTWDAAEEARQNGLSDTPTRLGGGGCWVNIYSAEANAEGKEFPYPYLAHLIIGMDLTSIVFGERRDLFHFLKEVTPALSLGIATQGLNQGVVNSVFR